MPTGILSSAYRVAATASAPLVAVGLACSARGRRRYAERFGAWERVPPVEWWLHGASVGEVQGLLPFVAAVRAELPRSKILLTSTSPTGLDRGGESFDHRRLLPIDVGLCVRRALSHVSAQRFVLAETELWPTFLTELLARNIPLHIVNGRVSDYTFQWYRKFRLVLAPILARARTISVAYDAERERYLELGARPEAIHVTGHSKYDVEPRFVSGAARASFFPDEPLDTPIVVLGSMRPGEDEGWLQAIKHSLLETKRLKVILAPRHMEKVEYFARRLSESGVSWRLWSASSSDPSDVVVLDTMGRLEEAYACASLAFIGGTLVDVGGHNPLEPAMYGVPVVIGPYTAVIREVVQEMRQRNGIIDATSANDLKVILGRLVAADAALRDVGERGQEVWLQHRGAAKRILSVIHHG